jgi:hypothetical protein
MISRGTVLKNLSGIHRVERVQVYIDRVERVPSPVEVARLSSWKQIHSHGRSMTALYRLSNCYALLLLLLHEYD